MSPMKLRWYNMKRRCQSPAHSDYKYYGARGINVSEEWEDFDTFMKDFGYLYQPGLSIDRIDNTKGYNKENCRWATRKKQANNRRTNRIITIDGISKTLKQWAEEYNIDYHFALCQINKGFSFIDILKSGDKNFPKSGKRATDTLILINGEVKHLGKFLKESGSAIRYDTYHHRVIKLRMDPIKALWLPPLKRGTKPRYAIHST